MAKSREAQFKECMDRAQESFDKGFFDTAYLRTQESEYYLDGEALDGVRDAFIRALRTLSMGEVEEKLDPAVRWRIERALHILDFKPRHSEKKTRARYLTNALAYLDIHPMSDIIPMK